MHINKTTPFEQHQLSVRFQALKVNINNHAIPFSDREQERAKEAFLEDFYLDLDEELNQTDLNLAIV